MKKIVVIGARGFVGSAILSEAINRCYRVTAVVRSPEKITLKSENLAIVKADVLPEGTVAELCNGFGTVISAYNPGWTNPNISEETLSVYQTILNEAKTAGVRRLLCNEKEIDWIFYSPAGAILPGEHTGKFHLGKDDLIVDKGGNSNISVEDYAVAMMNELKNEAHHWERFTIGY